MPFRFVHTADIHLDSPLRSLAMRDPALADLVGSATRAAFVRIIDLCLAEAVDALLIAGDLYDGHQTSMKTAQFLALQLQRLDRAGVRVFVIRGNHDALSRITRELVLPPNTHVFGAKAGVVHLPRPAGDRPVAVHGLSFAQPQAAKSLLPAYAPPVPDAINIGMMHTSLNGAPGHDPYAPCALADLDQSGFDYWALGHIHRRSVWQGRATVVMPGNPQGRDIGEAGPKSATLVTITDDGAVGLQDFPTAAVQFERVAIDLTGLDRWEDVIAAQAAALRAARRAHGADHLVLRPTLTGRSALLPRLLRDGDLLLAEAQHAAQGIGSVWIDKVELAAEAETGRDDTPGNVLGALDGLRRELHQRVLQSEALRAEFDAELSQLLRALPRELRTLSSDLMRDVPADLAALLGDDEAARAAALANLGQAGSDEVLARLAPVAQEVP